MFLIVSDGLEWCRKELMPLTKNVVVSTKGRSAIEDVALLSLGEHVIVTQGTYGLFGAIIAGGDILYPGSKFTELPYFIQEAFNRIKDPRVIKIEWT